MRLSDLAGMDLLKDWHETPERGESFDQTLRRVGQMEHLYRVIREQMPCTADREQYVLMVLFADATSAAAEQLRRRADEFKDQLLAKGIHADDLPF